MNSIRTLTRTIFFRSCYRNVSSGIPLLNTRSDLKISRACIDRLKQISTDGVFLRITVDGGGCSGFQYRFDLDSKIHDDDICFDKDGVKVVVDKMSLDFLKGSTVDYHEELIRAAFRIVDNPQADSKCSCGASFSMKMS